MSASGYAAFDLDGTLALYTTWDEQRGRIGEPIEPMMRMLREHLALGVECRILTARAGDPDEKRKVEAWLAEQGLPPLVVTDKKCFRMVVLYDDNAVQVEKNTGRILGRLLERHRFRGSA